MDLIDEAAKLVKKVENTVNEFRDDVRGFTNNGKDLVRNHRRVKVELINKSGKSIKSVLVKHKYSGDFFDVLWLNDVKDGTSAIADREIEYATGIITTGMDWWFVIGVFDDGESFFTDESAGAEFLDKTIFAADAAVAGIAMVATGGLSKLASAAGLSLSGEPTTGFKSYTLPAEADQRPVRITILPSEARFDANGKDEDNIRLLRVKLSDPTGSLNRVADLWDFRGGAHYAAFR